MSPSSRGGSTTEKTTKLSHAQSQVAVAISNKIDGGQVSVTLGGLAGTGKTTLVGQLPQVIGVDPGRVAFCAYTGKAATVINRKYPLAQASTIHKLVYRPVETHDKKCPRLESEKARCLLLDDCRLSYQPRPVPRGEPSLIIVDEASMVPESIYQLILSYHVPVIWVGDHGQLGPVRSAFNLMADPELRLEEIHRTARDSAIVRVAMFARKNGRPPKSGRYKSGEVEIRPGPKVPGFDLDEMARGEMVYLVGTNYVRCALNRSVRTQLGHFAGEPVVGDRVVCLRNNDEMGIYNGMTGTVLDFDIEPSEPEYGVMTVALDYEDRVYRGRVALDQFLSQSNKQDEYHRSDADLWDYGYALTVHKAQGSEYDRVVVLWGNRGFLSEPHRWLYTAATRAKKQLQIVM